MSILVRFAPASLTAEQYDQVREKIQSATQWPPDGLELHVCFGSGDQMRVSEVWESREQFDAFGAHVMPILSEAGIDVESTAPEFLDVHAVDVPSGAAAA